MLYEAGVEIRDGLPTRTFEARARAGRAEALPKGEPPVMAGRE
jgi:hypothetical protein